MIRKADIIACAGKSARGTRLALLAIALCVLAGVFFLCLPCSQQDRAYADPDLVVSEPGAPAYPIAYHLNGGSQPASQLLEVADGQTLSVKRLKKPSKLGCKFLGWYVDAALTKKASSVKGVSNAAKRMLYAKWERRAYPIVYVLNGGSNRSGQTALVKARKTLAVKKLKKPTRKGYTFAGWFRDEKLTKRASAVAGKAALSRRTLYAKWKINVYSLSYSLNGGKSWGNYPDSYKTTYSAKLPVPVREGYDFAGWCTDKALKKNIGRSLKGLVGDRTLYAKWNLNVYSIAYVLDGGTLPDDAPRTYSVKSPIGEDEMPVPKKEGFSFIGWYSDEGRTDIVTSIPSTSRGNKKLYARWEARELVAHRGLRANAVENSVQAFENAAAKGFSKIELDVHFTADGVPVLVHDQTVSIFEEGEGGSVTKISVPVASIDYERLQTAAFAQAKSGTDGKNLATFEEGIESCRACGLDVIIHMKVSAVQQIDTLFSIVDDLGMRERVFWLASDLTALHYVRALDSKAAVMYLRTPTERIARDAAELAKDGKAMISCDYSQLTKSKIDFCKKHGVLLAVWTLEDETKVKGMDPYIFSFTIDAIRGDAFPDVIEV